MGEEANAKVLELDGTLSLSPIYVPAVQELFILEYASETAWFRGNPITKFLSSDCARFS